MLEIVIPDREYFDEGKQEFVNAQGVTLQLEHSLVSLSKWESKWCIPFLKKSEKEEKTTEQLLDYIKCMTVTQNVKMEVYQNLTQENVKDIENYIAAPMTATWFREKPGGASGFRETITAELIYYWMFSHGIPMECQKWHLNRLLTLIRVCNIKSAPTKPAEKPGPDAMAQRRALNAARRAKLGSKG